MLAEQQSDELGTVVALLHDVLEDTPLTRHSLVFHGFPDEVVEAVVALTRRADELYSVYLARVRDNALARRVKLADLRHNSDLSRLSSVSPLDRARVEKYRQAMEFLSQYDTAPEV
ncbi:MAG: GTP pyrophosphokinase [Sphaerochaetaceae bacterium]